MLLLYAAAKMNTIYAVPTTRILTVNLLPITSVAKMAILNVMEYAMMIPFLVVPQEKLIVTHKEVNALLITVAVIF